MQIGRKLFYEKSTGTIIRDTGEREGFVIETTPEEDFLEYDLITMDYMELSYGERADEFQYRGSYEVNPQTKELIIYPLLKAEQTHITTTINQEVYLKVYGVDQGNVVFTLDGVSNEVVANKLGEFILPFSSNVVGVFQIYITSEVNGSMSITVEVSEL